jgi:hypothetical protein
MLMNVYVFVYFDNFYISIKVHINYYLDFHIFFMNMEIDVYLILVSVFLTYFYIY